MQELFSTDMGTSRRTALLTGLGAGALVALGAGNDTAQAVTAGKPFYDAITDVGCVPDARIETFTRDNRTWNHGDKRRIAFGTDNAERINKFLEKISKEQGGGIVVFPAGSYLVSGIVLQPGTGIKGASMYSTKLILADNSNRSVVTNRLADSKHGNAYGVSVEDLTIDGNRWGQWGLNWSEKPSYELSEPHIKQSHGVLLHRLPTNKDGSIDSYSLIQNVHVQFTWGSAFNTREHGGEVRVINCHARRVGGHGFVTGWDMQVHNCTSGESEYDGFRVQHGSTVISSCKAFRAGVMAHDGLREGIAYPGKEAAGFHFSGAGHVIGVGLNAQNNTGAGIVLESVRGVALYGILSDSNNMQAVTEWEGKWPWVSREYYNHKAQLAAEKASGKDSSWRIAKPDSFDSVKFRGNASHCIVEGISWASQAQGGQPTGFNHHAVSFQEGCHTNRVSLSHRSEDGSNPRRAGGILNKKKTPEVARLKNRITDHLGNDYGMLPWTMESLEIPVISRGDRNKYQSPNKKIIDKDKGILLWYKKETNQWIRTTDGKPD